MQSAAALVEQLLATLDTDAHQWRDEWRAEAAAWLAYSLRYQRPASSLQRPDAPWIKARPLPAAQQYQPNANATLGDVLAEIEAADPLCIECELQDILHSFFWKRLAAHAEALAQQEGLAIEAYLDLPGVCDAEFAVLSLDEEFDCPLSAQIAYLAHEWWEESLSWGVSALLQEGELAAYRRHREERRTAAKG